MDEEKKSIFRKAEEERRKEYRKRLEESRTRHESVFDPDEDELDIKDLAESSIEDENKSMFDLNEFKLPEIDFDSTEEKIEEEIEEESDDEEEKEISVKEHQEAEEEIPDMSPMNLSLIPISEPTRPHYISNAVFC